MRHTVRFRVVTYNIHKCVGMDRRLSPTRIAHVISETEADIVALQEVVRTEEERRGADQALEIAEAAGFAHCCFGANRSHWGGTYGNAILSRWPITAWHNHDLTIRGREPRGMLQATIDIPKARSVYVLNLHLGTGYLERRRQADRLLGEEPLLRRSAGAPRVLLGDLNEWLRGKATRELSRHMKRAEFPSPAESKPAGRMRTYPGVLPLLHLDHIYYDEELKLVDFRVHRTKRALVASDHLPLIGDFEIET